MSSTRDSGGRVAPPQDVFDSGGGLFLRLGGTTSGNTWQKGSMRRIVKNEESPMDEREVFQLADQTLNALVIRIASDQSTVVLPASFARREVWSPPDASRGAECSRVRRRVGSRHVGWTKYGRGREGRLSRRSPRRRSGWQLRAARGRGLFGSGARSESSRQLSRYPRMRPSSTGFSG